MLKLTQEEGTSGIQTRKNNETGQHREIKITEISLDTQRCMTDGTKVVTLPVTKIQNQGGQITNKVNGRELATFVAATSSKRRLHSNCSKPNAT